MGSASLDAMAFETADPLEDGLRVLARIIARDILTKRAIVNGAESLKECGNDNDSQHK